MPAIAWFVGIVPACGGIDAIDGGMATGGGAGIGGGGTEGCCITGAANVGCAIGAIGAIDGGIGSGIDAGIASGIDAGIGSGGDEGWNGAPVGTAIGGGAGTTDAGRGPSAAVVEKGGRSSGAASGFVVGELGGREGVAGALGAMDFGAAGATDNVRGATEGGAGGAIEGARGAIGAFTARGGIDADLAGFTPETGPAAPSAGGASVMRRVPGAALEGGGGGGSTTLSLEPAADRARLSVRSASASAMSGGSPCAVAASSFALARSNGGGVFAAGATPAIVFRPGFERTVPPGPACRAAPGRGTRPSAFPSSDATAAPIRKLK